LKEKAKNPRWVVEQIRVLIALNQRTEGELSGSAQDLVRKSGA
jgi:hypothetical protein